jgi:hypothetical protein
VPKVPIGMFDRSKAYPVDGVILVDPNGEPYKAGVTVQQVEGGFDSTGLATESKQDDTISALEALTATMEGVEGPQEVVITDDQLPPVSGQATAAKQDSILSALGNLATVLGGALTVSPSGSFAITAESLPLPSGAATATGQANIVSALGALQTAIQSGLDVSGTVALEPGTNVGVSGTVTLGNTSIAVTPSGTFNVTVSGGATSAKQDTLLAAVEALTTAVQAPQPITDNGGSITVDGNVGVSGVVQVADNGGSLTVDGTVAATQSGTWNVGLTGTPSVAISGPVTVTDGSGPLTVDGTVNVGNSTLAVTQSGTWQIQTTPGASATSAALTSFRSGTVSTTAQSIKTSSGRVYQYTFYNPNAATVYIHLYDIASGSVTAGTTVPKMSFAVPAGSTLDGYWSISHGFATAISISASANWDGSGAPASTMQVTVGYA